MAFHDKAQAATEYMITYAWVILTLVVIGVGLYYVGFPDVMPTEKGTQGFGEINVVDWALRADGQMTFILLNEASTLVEVDEVTLSFLEGGQGGCNNAGPPNPLVDDFLPDTQETIDVSGCPVSASIGEYYRLNVSIHYNNQATSSESKSYGYVWGQVE